MEVIVIMLVGVIFGKTLIPAKYSNGVEKIQFFSIVALIFLMGVSLGTDEDFFSDLLYLGLASFIYAIIPIIFSTLLVYYLTKKAFGHFEEKK